MKWNISEAIIIGTEHIFAKSNRQDFCRSIVTDKGIFGVVCDGCSSGKYSETGAVLTGQFLLKTFQQLQISDIDVFKYELQSKLKLFFENLVSLMFETDDDKVTFIQDFLLTTFIFCIITNDRVLIGSAGDGITVIKVNGEISTNKIDHDNMPHYYAYNIVPPQYLSLDVKSDIKIEEYLVNEVESIIIGTDGLEPVLDKSLIDRLYKTNGRQLQRKFNVWQNKDKMFSDDVSCIVFEKVEDINESSI